MSHQTSRTECATPIRIRAMVPWRATMSPCRPVRVSWSRNASAAVTPAALCRPHGSHHLAKDRIVGDLATAVVRPAPRVAGLPLHELRRGRGPAIAKHRRGQGRAVFAHLIRCLGHLSVSAACVTRLIASPSSALNRRRPARLIAAWVAQVAGLNDRVAGPPPG